MDHMVSGEPAAEETGKEKDKRGKVNRKKRKQNFKKMRTRKRKKRQERRGKESEGSSCVLFPMGFVAENYREERKKPGRKNRKSKDKK